MQNTIPWSATRDRCFRHPELYTWIKCLQIWDKNLKTSVHIMPGKRICLRRTNNKLTKTTSGHLHTFLLEIWDPYNIVFELFSEIINRNHFIYIFLKDTQNKKKLSMALTLANRRWYMTGTVKLTLTSLILKTLIHIQAKKSLAKIDSCMYIWIRANLNATVT